MHSPSRTSFAHAVPAHGRAPVVVPHFVQTVALLLPPAIFIPFGLHMLLWPATAFNNPLLFGIVRKDLDPQLSPIGALGTQFGGAYVRAAPHGRVARQCVLERTHRWPWQMSYVGGFGLLTLLLGDSQARRFWLLGQVLFTGIAGLLVCDVMFLRPELMPYYSAGSGQVFNRQWWAVNLFTLFFFPLSLLGYFAEERGVGKPKAN